MRQKHNIVLVTNDHVEVLKDMSDNIITVSAIDRKVVKINDREGFDRTKAIYALAVGEGFHKAASHDEYTFFFDVEVKYNQALRQIGIFNVFCFALFLATFWDSSEESAALVLVAGGIIVSDERHETATSRSLENGSSDTKLLFQGFFGLNPAMLSLVEWRTAMLEEAEALMHASAETNLALKTALMVTLTLFISLLEYAVVNAVINGLESIKFWVAMLMDSVSMTFPVLCLSLYSSLPFQAVQLLGSLPFLFMIFLSTTFSPGAGVPIVKELRYLFARFYFWCMIPVSDVTCLPRCENIVPRSTNTSTQRTLYIVHSILVTRRTTGVPRRHGRMSRRRLEHGLADHHWLSWCPYLFVCQGSQPTFSLGQGTRETWRTCRHAG